MNNVKELLAIKGDKVWTVTPGVMIYEALQLMAEKNIGAVIVTDKDRPVGIFSERDYCREVQLKGKSSTDTPVREIMTKEVCYVAPENKIKECMALMTAKRVRHLPVMDNNQLVGIVTIGDVVKSIISDQEFALKELEKYITGSY